jgi:hypothetical protein
MNPTICKMPRQKLLTRMTTLWSGLHNVSVDNPLLIPLKKGKLRSFIGIKVWTHVGKFNRSYNTRLQAKIIDTGILIFKP